MGKRIPIEIRLWAKVDKHGPIPAHRPELGPCWVWTCATREGYGAIWYNGRTVGAHCVAYELEREPIPDGLVIDHLCRNRLCCNPAHLEPVTDGVNIRRGVSPFALNAAKTNCPAGHPYDEENTYVDRDGGRQCKMCHHQRQQEAWQLKSQGLGLPGGRTHCPQNHPYDEANTLYSGGKRHCRTCRRERQQASRAAAKRRADQAACA